MITKESLTTDSVVAQTQAPDWPWARFPLVSVNELRNARAVDWLWDGYLARRCITLLTSQWKTGKTTLLALLLSRMESGGTLAGRAVSAGEAVVVSEEGPDLWLLRRELLGPGRQARLLCRPFDARPSIEDWERLVSALVDEHARRPLSLVAVDSLTGILPGAEASADSVRKAVTPLTRLTTRGVAVALMHHPRKGEWRPGQAARGSGALADSVDIVMEMTVPTDPGGGSTRRRRLQAWGRPEGIPRRLLVELTADGRDYIDLGDWHESEFFPQWPLLKRIFERALTPLTRHEIERAWPADRAERPSFRTLHRWLQSAVAHGHLARSGLGHARAPFRYALPHRQPPMAATPLTGGTSL